MSDSNNNKTWKVTIELAVVATEDPIVDDAFFNHMYTALVLDVKSATSVEGVILIGAEAVELEARSYTLKTEPVTKPVTKPTVLGPPPYNEPRPEPAQVLELEPRRLLKKNKYGPRIGGARPRRLRGGVDAPGRRVFEFVYFSHDYRNASKYLSIGVHSTKDKRECVWLTAEEVCLVNIEVMDRRAHREARRAARRANLGGE